MIYRKYGTGTGADIYIPIIKRSSVDFAVSADWTPAAGDVKVSKDGGAAANIGTLPTAVTMGNTAMWKFVLADSELQCKVLAITIADSATKAVEDQMILVETYGHASAMFQQDLSAAQFQSDVAKINGVSASSVTAVNANMGTTQPINHQGTGANALIKSDLRNILGTAPTETAGGRLAGAFTAFFDVGSPVLTTASVNQTGDSYSRLGAPNGASISADIQTRASSTEVTAIQNNTRAVIVVPEVIERPDSGTDTYVIHLYLYDEVGNMEAPDSAPTVALVNAAGTDRSSRLASVTGTLVNTGHYKWTYTNTSTDTLEQLLWEFSVVEGGATRLFGRQSLLVDTSAVDFTASDRTKLNTLAADYTTARAVKLDNLDTTNSSRASQSSVDLLPTANANADALLDRASAIDGKTMREALRIIAAGVLGKVSGAGTSTEVFVGLDGATTRATVTADADGNRTAVTYG